MAPSLLLMIWATPVFWAPPWELPGHFTVSPEPRVHLSDAASRYLVKLLVVPEPSERWAMMMFVLGRVASGLSALMAASSHFLMSPWKMPASVSGESWSLSTSGRL